MPLKKKSRVFLVSEEELSRLRNGNQRPALSDTREAACQTEDDFSLEDDNDDQERLKAACEIEPQLLDNLRRRPLQEHQDTPPPKILKTHTQQNPSHDHPSTLASTLLQDLPVKSRGIAAELLAKLMQTSHFSFDNDAIISFPNNPLHKLHLDEVLRVYCVPFTRNTLPKGAVAWLWSLGIPPRNHLLRAFRPPRPCPGWVAKYTFQ